MIPKIIHQIWIGNINNIPKSQLYCIETCKSMYSNYIYMFWTLDIIKLNDYFNDLRLKFFINNIKNKKFLNIELKENTYNVLINDILRFKILSEFGGIYFDNDFEHIKKIEDNYLTEYNVITCGNIKTRDIYVGFMGSSCNNDFMKQCYNLTYDNIDKFNDNIFPYFDPKFITGDNLNTIYFNNKCKDKIKIFNYSCFYSKDNYEYTIHRAEQSWV